MDGNWGCRWQVEDQGSGWWLQLSAALYPNLRHHSAPQPKPRHQGLEAQLRQCRAMYSAVPSEANRFQLVRLERLLQVI